VVRGRKRPIFVFECYIDDSGTTDLPVVTLGGFLGFQGHWKALEPKLDDILNRYEVPVFHAKEFHRTRPPFKGWTRIKKLSVAEELFTASHGILHGLSMTVSKKEIQRAKKETGAFASMSPIGVCFSSMMVRLVTDPSMATAVRQDGVSLLIESGNKNNGGLIAYFHKMSKHPMFEGVFRAISIVDKGSCRAIQLADFIAFYSRRNMRNQERFRGKVILPQCPYLQIMARHGPVWHGSGFAAPKPVGNVRNVINIHELTELRRESATASISPH
jgi:Protein of unknown function (DUF3800)